jgi:hypothetical protein
LDIEVMRSLRLAVAWLLLEVAAVEAEEQMRLVEHFLLALTVSVAMGRSFVLHRIFRRILLQELILTRSFRNMA